MKMKLVCIYYSIVILARHLIDWRGNWLYYRFHYKKNK